MSAKTERDALCEAIELAAELVEYVDPFLREKHGYDDQIAGLRENLV